MDVIRKDGTPFRHKNELASVLARKKLDYDMVETDEGWIGKPKTETKVATKTKPKSKELKCRVYHANTDPGNADMEISVTVNTAASKKIFWPGVDVMLTQAHINVLKDSVEETRFDIPSESAIYSSRDPITAAKNNYPAMRAEVNPSTGLITMFRSMPNYLVEIVEEAQHGNSSDIL